MVDSKKAQEEAAKFAFEESENLNASIKQHKTTNSPVLISEDKDNILPRIESKKSVNSDTLPGADSDSNGSVTQIDKVTNSDMSSSVTSDCEIVAINSTTNSQSSLS